MSGETSMASMTVDKKRKKNHLLKRMAEMQAGMSLPKLETLHYMSSR